MNIIFIHTHDTGRAIEPYGFPVETPNLMNFAHDCIQFNNAFCTSPTCSPSRASLLTGHYPHEVSMLGLAHRGFSLDPVDKHISARMKKMGYHTVLAGIQHEVPCWNMLDYDEYVGSDPEAPMSDSFDPLAWDSNIAGELISWICNSETIHEPFFLFWGLFEPHRPFPREGEYEENSPLPLFNLPDTAAIRKDLASYKAGVKHSDYLIGRVIKALKQRDIYDESVILYTTDHGIPFPGYKCTLSDRGTGVSLLLKFPESVKKSRDIHQCTIDEMISHLDIIPTINELIGENDDTLPGKSLLPLFNSQLEKGEPLHEYLFSEISYHAAYEPARAVRTDRYKLVRRFTPYPFFPSNIDNSPAKEAMIGPEPQDGIYIFPKLNDRGKSYFDFLYDLVADPNETVDLMSMLDTDISVQKIYKELDKALIKWISETNDPIERGVVFPPKGARISANNAYSPKGVVVDQML